MLLRISSHSRSHAAFLPPGCQAASTTGSSFAPSRFLLTAHQTNKAPRPLSQERWSLFASPSVLFRLHCYRDLYVNTRPLRYRLDYDLPIAFGDQIALRPKLVADLVRQAI